MLSVGKGWREPGLCTLPGDPKLIQVFWKATGNMYQKPQNGHSLPLVLWLLKIVLKIIMMHQI